MVEREVEGEVEGDGEGLDDQSGGWEDGVWREGGTAVSQCGPNEVTWPIKQGLSHVHLRPSPRFAHLSRPTTWDKNPSDPCASDRVFNVSHRSSSPVGIRPLFLLLLLYLVVSISLSIFTCIFCYILFL